ncbi:hypothetical protein HDU90_005057 [Geranomyces variabilis]|nr:hypothetical protein HDU90_005057 [Geranomyces variabilis]
MRLRITTPSRANKIRDYASKCSKLHSISISRKIAQMQCKSNARSSYPQFPRFSKLKRYAVYVCLDAKATTEPSMFNLISPAFKFKDPVRFCGQDISREAAVNGGSFSSTFALLDIASMCSGRAARDGFFGFGASDLQLRRRILDL